MTNDANETKPAVQVTREHERLTEELYGRWNKYEGPPQDAVAEAIAEAEQRGESRGRAAERADVIAECELTAAAYWGSAADVVESLRARIQRGEHVGASRVPEPAKPA